ncbi:uncharacterized protein MKK02DRAFT_41888 [Dioszegia hungarica]|uniref:Uncharacterized protein n=1 Tax=Dioszegia hungarica TaxID=4972 RepID=A0AA38HGB9_9TREE|nr:uncharacterized protein MKK02DRAFT_41888 [Dioszegia hungarica]KAI9638861.1 hypothetical protein MKK02DRAFT_41888 [Dioszegia hungarica]
MAYSDTEEKYPVDMPEDPGPGLRGSRDSSTQHGAAMASSPPRSDSELSSAPSSSPSPKLSVQSFFEAEDEKEGENEECGRMEVDGKRVGPGEDRRMRGGAGALRLGLPGPGPSRERTVKVEVGVEDVKGEQSTEIVQPRPRPILRARPFRELVVLIPLRSRHRAPPAQIPPSNGETSKREPAQSPPVDVKPDVQALSLAARAQRRHGGGEIETVVKVEGTTHVKVEPRETREHNAGIDLSGNRPARRPYVLLPRRAANGRSTFPIDLTAPSRRARGRSVAVAEVSSDDSDSTGGESEYFESEDEPPVRRKRSRQLVRSVDHSSDSESSLSSPPSSRAGDSPAEPRASSCRRRAESPAPASDDGDPSRWASRLGYLQLKSNAELVAIFTKAEERHQETGLSYEKLGKELAEQDKTYTLVTWNHLFRWWRQKAERFSDDRQIATNSMLSTPEMDEILRNAHPLSVKSGGSYEDVVEHVHAKYPYYSQKRWSNRYCHWRKHREDFYTLPHDPHVDQYSALFPPYLRNIKRGETLDTVAAILAEDNAELGHSTKEWNLYFGTWLRLHTDKPDPRYLTGGDARDARYEAARVEMAKLFKRDYDSSVFLHRLVGDEVAKAMPSHMASTITLMYGEWRKGRKYFATLDKELHFTGKGNTDALAGMATATAGKKRGRPRRSDKTGERSGRRKKRAIRHDDTAVR